MLRKTSKIHDTVPKKKKKKSNKEQMEKLSYIRKTQVLPLDIIVKIERNKLRFKPKKTRHLTYSLIE